MKQNENKSNKKPIWQNTDFPALNFTCNVTSGTKSVVGSKKNWQEMTV